MMLPHRGIYSTMILGEERNWQQSSIYTGRDHL